jgi:hypothetical protein
MASDHDNPERAERVADLLRGAAQSERAPDALQMRISAMQAQATAAPRRALLPRRAFNYARVAMPAAAAGVAALVLALGGSAGAPSLAQAAALSTRAPTAGAPSADPSDPGRLLSVKVGTLHFPNWVKVGGWRAVGQRHDQIGNRTATTVYYATASGRVAYSIVSSPTLAMKSGQLPRTGPLRYQHATTLRTHGRLTVVWVEAGHTCLLTGSRARRPDAGAPGRRAWSASPRAPSAPWRPRGRTARRRRRRSARRGTARAAPRSRRRAR